MNALTLLFIVGFLSVGALALAIFVELHKTNAIEKAPAPESGRTTPRETAARMMRRVRMGHFLMHIIPNEANLFDDDAGLAKYKAFIQNPSVISYLKNLGGGQVYE